MRISQFGLELFVWQTFLILFVVILPVSALVDILKSRFRDNDKLIWVLVVILLNFVGSILYFLLGRKQKINP